jgi:hypothetical protein
MRNWGREAEVGGWREEVEASESRHQRDCTQSTILEELDGHPPALSIGGRKFNRGEAAGEAERDQALGAGIIRVAAREQRISTGVGHKRANSTRLQFAL